VAGGLLVVLRKKKSLTTRLFPAKMNQTPLPFEGVGRSIRAPPPSQIFFLGGQVQQTTRSPILMCSRSQKSSREKWSLKKQLNPSLNQWTSYLTTFTFLGARRPNVKQIFKFKNIGNLLKNLNLPSADLRIFFWSRHIWFSACGGFMVLLHILTTHSAMASLFLVQFCRGAEVLLVVYKNISSPFL